MVLAPRQPEGITCISITDLHVGDELTVTTKSGSIYLIRVDKLNPYQITFIHTEGRFAGLSALLQSPEIATDQRLTFGYGDETKEGQIVNTSAITKIELVRMASVDPSDTPTPHLGLNVVTRDSLHGTLRGK